MRILTSNDLKDGEVSCWKLLARTGRCVVAAIASATTPAYTAPIAEAHPRTPCDVDPEPGYPRDTPTPAVRIWRDAEIAEGWTPGTCTGWAPSRFQTVLAIAARFHHDGGVEELSSRFAAVSAWAAIRYWSVTDKAPRPLLTDAAALSGPRTSLRRSDFKVEEMEVGKDLYLSQVDSRSAGTAIYRMRVVEMGPTRLVINLENASTIRAFLVPLFYPGDLQSVYFFSKLGPGVWGYYSLAATKVGASALTGGHEASFINRAAALYEHFAGLPAFAGSPVKR